MHTITDARQKLHSDRHPRGLTTLAIVVLLTAYAAACDRTRDVERIPAGTPVAITLNDGSHVEGRLLRVEPDTLVVQKPDGLQERTIARANVKDVDTADSRASAPAGIEPQFDEIVLPAGTDIPVRLETTVSSDASRAEDVVRAAVREAVVVNGHEVIPAGSAVTGAVTTVVPSGKVKGRAVVSFAFDRLTAAGTTYTLGTTPLSYRAESTKKEDATKIGVGAAAGALIGGIAGGKKGAAVGTAVGAGAGTAMVLTTAGDEVTVRAGRELQLNLTQPLTVRVPRRRS